MITTEMSEPIKVGLTPQISSMVRLKITLEIWKWKFNIFKMRIF